jgi:catechol 2,3-dioxygenase-like lactoylglutathione lyase family enzyme
VKLTNPQVNLYVKDIESEARFYVGLLGFRETFRTPDEGPPIHVELRLGAFTLGLALQNAASQVHGVSTGTGPARAEVAFWVEDTDAAFAELKAKGAGVISTPHDFGPSLRGAWLSDPEGNPVQIVCRLKRRE